jgi:hypothetical protein
MTKGDSSQYKQISRSSAKLHYNLRTGDIITYREYLKYKKDNSYTPRIFNAGNSSGRYAAVPGSKGKTFEDIVTGQKITKYQKVKRLTGLSPTEYAKKNKHEGKSKSYYKRKEMIRVLWREYYRYLKAEGVDVSKLNEYKPNMKDKEFRDLLDRFDDPLTRHYVIDEYAMPETWEYYGPGDTPD